MSPRYRRPPSSARRRPPPTAFGLLDRLGQRAAGFAAALPPLANLPPLSRRTALLVVGVAGLVGLVAVLVVASLPDRPSPSAAAPARSAVEKAAVVPNARTEGHAAALAQVRRFAEERADGLYRDVPVFGKADLIRSFDHAVASGADGGALPAGSPALWYDDLDQHRFARVFVYHRGPAGLTFCVSSQSGALAGLDAPGRRVVVEIGRTIARYFVIDYSQSALPQPALVADLPTCLDRLTEPGDLVRLGPWGQCDGVARSLCDAE